MKRSSDELTILDNKLNIDNYNGKLKRPQIRAIRNWRAEHAEALRGYSANYYKKNRDDVLLRRNRRSAIARINNGQRVSEKTRLKYNITDEDLA
jgi:hypothetical protein